MSAERLLVFALAVVSTLAAGLAADPHAPSPVAPRRLAIVVAANVVALPVATWLLLRALGSVDGGHGLVLAAAAPGGSTGPLLALLSGGHAGAAARSFIVLTVAGTASALLATLALDAAGLSSVLVASAAVALTSLGPLLLGGAARRRRPALAARWQPHLSRASVVLLAATIALLAVRHGSTARAADVVIGAVATSLALAIGLAAAGRATRVAVAQVSAVRNLTLALVVLAAVDAPPADTVAVLSYGLAMYALTLAAAAAWRSTRKVA